LSNELAELISLIQFKTRKNLDEIAESIGYSRPYLSKAKKGTGDVSMIVGKLKEMYADILPKDTLAEKPDNINARFEDQIALYKENTEYLKKDIRQRLEKLEASLLNLTERIERNASQNHSQDILNKMNKLAEEVQALVEAATRPTKEAKAILQRKRESQQGE